MSIPLAVTQTRSLFLGLVPQWTVAAPSLSTLLRDWLSGILMAVPKHRTTHSKKRMRMTHKWQKPMENIVPCPVCHEPKLMHHLCKNCVRQAFKEF